jgi:hypothetical protein
MTSREGRVTSYQIKPQSNGDMLRINTSPDNTQVQSLKEDSGAITVTYSDDTTIVSQQAPDPRFGMQAPFAEQTTITTPGGLTSKVNLEKTAVLFDTNNPFSVATLTTKVTTNGRTSSSVYESAANKITTTSAKGRRTISYLMTKDESSKKKYPI